MNNPYSQPQRQTGYNSPAQNSNHPYSYWQNQNAPTQHAPPPPVASFAPPHVGQPQPIPNPTDNPLYANYGYGPQWQRQQQQQTQFAASPQPFAFQPPAPVMQQPAYSPFQPQMGQQAAFQQSPTPPFVQAPPQPYRQPPPGPAAMQFVSIPQPAPQLSASFQGANPYSQASRVPPLKRPRHNGTVQPPSHPRLHNVSVPHRHQQPSINTGPRLQNVGGSQAPLGGRGTSMFAAQPMNGNRVPLSSPMRGLPSAPRNKMGRSMPHRDGGGIRGNPSNSGTLAGRMHVRNFNNSFGRRSNGPYNSGKRHQQSIAANGRLTDENRDTNGSSESTRKDENRRSLTDFKIIGWCIPELDWSWGICRSQRTEVPVVNLSLPSKPVVKEEVDADSITYSNQKEKQKDSGHPSYEPPSRLRFYFHAPFEENSSYPPAPIAISHGKRKKYDDEDEEPHERNIRPRQTSIAPSIEMTSSGDGAHDSFAEALDESVTRTPETDDGDWLMAAIGEENEGGDGSPLANKVDVKEDVDAMANAGIEAELDDRKSDTPVEEAGTDVSFMLGLGVDSSASEPEIPPKEDVEPQPCDQNAAVEIDRTTEAANGDTETLELNANSSSDVIPSFGVEAPNVESADPHPQVESAGASSTNLVTVASHSEGSPGANIVTVPSLSRNVADLSSLTEDNTPRNSPVTMLETELQMSSNATSISRDSSLVADLRSPTSLLHGDVASKDDQIEDLTSPSQVAETETEVDSLGPAVVTHVPSQNRLSILYAASHRRLALDADVVQNVKLFRKEGRCEARVSLEDREDGIKGLMFEQYIEETQCFAEVNLATFTEEEDELIPPLARLQLPTLVTVVIFLDTDKPLSEPGWCKSGNVEEWLKREFGAIFPKGGWESRIEVVDPERALTMSDIIETWCIRSSFGSPEERERFRKTYMSEPENVYEILLRHIRGERPHPPSAPRAAFSGPLLSALEQSTIPASQQTHATLAVLATANLALEYAEKAEGDNGRVEAYRRLGDIVQHLPVPHIHRSLDLIFRDWKAAKKGTSR